MFRTDHGNTKFAKEDAKATLSSVEKALNWIDGFKAGGGSASTVHYLMLELKKGVETEIRNM